MTLVAKSQPGVRIFEGLFSARSSCDFMSLRALTSTCGTVFDFEVSFSRYSHSVVVSLLLLALLPDRRSLQAASPLQSGLGSERGLPLELGSLHRLASPSVGSLGRLL